MIAPAAVGCKPRLAFGSRPKQRGVPVRLLHELKDLSLCLQELREGFLTFGVHGGRRDGLGKSKMILKPADQGHFFIVG
jgi:hypothetical protein